MPDYDFSQLSPHDFELLCRDLFQGETGLTLESFKSGKDGGIDFRHARGGANIVIQCKRFVETGVVGLLRELGKEAGKVARIAPNRYVLMTAVPLSDANKTQIIKVIGNNYLAKADIYGRADINNLLGTLPEVERAHYKLWLASTNVLESVLHNDVVMQTRFQVEKIHGEIKRYVQGNAYPRALAALDKDRVVILSGLPGVGKTTLANMLLYEHLHQEYEPVVIRQDFAEGERLFRKGRRQVFYFDDFMGVTFLGDKGSADQQREYRAILDFIEMVAGSKGKRLILTTREQMFRQAWAASEQIRNAGLDERRMVIHMGDYSRRQRAEILYNHLFFSDLPTEYRDELLRGEFYFKIVKHEKFNPRLIEWLSSYRQVQRVAVKTYQTFVEDMLANPAEIWHHAYEQQISDAGRSLLLALFSLGGSASDADLRESFGSLHARRAKVYGLQRRPDDFSAARAELHGAFIRPTVYGAVEFVNPSVQDWLNSVVRTQPDTVLDLVLGAAFFSQIERIWRFANSKFAGETRDILCRHIERLAPHIERLALRQQSGGSTAGTSTYVGPSFEKRISVVIEMADDFRAPVLLPLIEAIIARIDKVRETQYCTIADMITAIKCYRRVQWEALDLIQPFFDRCGDELVESAIAECSSDELRNILYLFENNDASEMGAEHPLREALQDAYDNFVENSFSGELGTCQTEGSFTALINDLEYFGRVFDVDVSHQISYINEGLEEYQLAEDQRADQQMEDYRERRSIERTSDEGIRDLFSSLRTEG
ncbi:nSTAND3 domain-containing NTPase [Sphingobium sp. YR768]|uniref:nSTAND3 domain-containing NTPase n=1 Tax=Sphingobium sp. YR768 TaxID=1884365 RepID=UPI0008C625B7|nr:restriction endonuclease [Sphingobium sp. YR768]SER90111.1 Restriction endonuclease [Sphingobium sp. YR768]